MTNDSLAYLRTLFPDHLTGEVYAVGGCVRDWLLGRESNDLDLVASLPAEVMERCGFRLVTGKTTAPIWFRHIPSRGKIEVTLLPHAGLLADDLRGRDFTINAIAMGMSGELVDPLGGEADLRAGRLRACSREAFANDPVRIFRGFRFESDGWRLTSDTVALVEQGEWSEQLGGIPCERLTRELLKALAGREPERFFQRMLEFRVGTEWLPELFRMALVPAGPPKYHPEGDVFSHALSALEAAAAMTADPLARFCAFFHDLGKLATDPSCYPKHHGHDLAGAAMAEGFCNRLCLPATYRRALAATCRLHMHLNRWHELRPSTKLRVAEQAVKGGVVDILPVVAASDRRGNPPPPEWPHVVRVAGMTTTELRIDPDKLLTVPPSLRATHILHRRVEVLKSRLREIHCT